MSKLRKTAVGIAVAFALTMMAGSAFSLGSGSHPSTTMVNLAGSKWD